MWFKRQAAVLGDFEQLVLFGVMRLEDEAYGAAIRQQIHTRSGRDVSINAVCTTLDRLEGKGLLRSWVGGADRAERRPPPQVLQADGVRPSTLRQAYRTLTAMAVGLERRLETK